MTKPLWRFRRRSNLSPVPTSIQIGFGAALFKRYPDAIAALEKSAKTHPNEEVVMGNLADGYRWSGQREKAKAAYAKAISLAIAKLGVNPKDGQCLRGFGTVLR